MIGLGKRSIDDHLPSITQSLNFELVGVCDIDQEKTREVSLVYDVPGYTDTEDVISNQDFQVAIVAIPHHAYLSVINALIMADKHIIKEKPFATSITEARQLLQVLNGRSVYFDVIVQRRFNPIYQTFHQLKQYIGKVYSIEGAYTMNVVDLDDGWRSSQHLAGGGALVDMGYHFVDLLVWYFGMPTSVTARITRGNRPNQRYDVEDTIHLLLDYYLELQYAEKLLGSFIISRIYPEKQEYIHAFGTNGAIEVSRGLIRRLDINGNEIERLERKGGWPSAAIAQLDYFAEKIHRFIPGMSSDYTEHLQHVAIIEAAYKSDRMRASCAPNELLTSIQEIE